MQALWVAQGLRAYDGSCNKVCMGQLVCPQPQCDCMLHLHTAGPVHRQDTHRTPTLCVLQSKGSDSRRTRRTKDEPSYSPAVSGAVLQVSCIHIGMDGCLATQHAQLAAPGRHAEHSLSDCWSLARSAVLS